MLFLVLIFAIPSMKAQTLEEYKNKEFIYSMTEVAVIVERMTITLENLEFQSKSISTNFLTRIELELEKIRGESFKNWSLEEINQWWEVLQDNFKKLNEKFINLLSAVDNGLYGKILQIGDDCRDKLVTNIGDAGVNLYVESQYVKLIKKPYEEAKKEMLKVLFNYKGI